MLTSDPSKRPSANTIKDHQWLKMKVSESKVQLSKDLGGKLKGFASKGKFKKVALTMIAQQMKEEYLAQIHFSFSKHKYMYV